MSNPRTLRVGLIAALSLAAAPSLAEQVLFSSIPNLAVAPDGNVYYDIHPCTGIACSLVLDKFNYQDLAPQIVINAVQFSIETPTSPITAIGFGIWSDNNGSPGQVILGEGAGPPAISTIETQFGTTIVTIPLSLNIPTGTYWIDFRPSTLTLPSATCCTFSSVGGIPGYSGGSGNLLYNESAPYPYDFVHTGDSAAFAILGGPSAPEPSTWVMILAGFAGLGFAGWRREQHASA
jgi:PEP-CTERM motif